MLEKSKRKISILSHAVLIIFSAITLFPLYITFNMAFKSNQEILTNVMGFARDFSFDTIKTVWVDMNFSRYFLNNILVAAPHLVVILLLSTMFTYAIVFLKIPYAGACFSIVLIGFMIPAQAIIVPLFHTLINLKMANSLFALSLVEAVIYIPFCMFILRSFMMDIPHEIYEVMLIDGANDFQIILNAILPMTKSALLSVFIIQFKNSWNEYLLPLVLLVDNKIQTLPLGFSRLQGGRYTLNYNMIGAGSLIMSVPMIVVFLLFQKKFINGIASGAVKG